MPVIRLNDAAFMNLKLLAKWFETETPSETMSYLINQEMNRQDLIQDDIFDVVQSVNEGILFDKAPGLTHTKVIFAMVNKQKVDRLTWGNILMDVIRSVRDLGLSKEAMVNELQINAGTCKVEDRGYTFYPELGLSVQGQSAPDAWKEAIRLSEKYSISVDVKFKWREKDGAQYPGKIGVMKSL